MPLWNRRKISNIKNRHQIAKVPLLQIKLPECNHSTLWWLAHSNQDDESKHHWQFKKSARAAKILKIKILRRMEDDEKFFFGLELEPRPTCNYPQRSPPARWFSITMSLTWQLEQGDDTGAVKNLVINIQERIRRKTKRNFSSPSNYRRYLTNLSRSSIW